MKKTVVVTGGAGFIGSHLCRFLLAKGFRVICVDNLLTGSGSNISDLKSNSDFVFINHDVTLPLEIREPVHYVLHFASPASPVDYAAFPIQTLKVGALGTHNMLGLAKAKEAVFLLASTSEVYGDPLVHPQPESYWGNVNPIGPRGVYDEAKRFAEAITMAYHTYHGMDTKIARIFNSILPDQLVVLFNDSDLHLETIGSYADNIEKNGGKIEHRIKVPCFDSQTCKIALKEVSAVIKHGYSGDAFELSLAYGRAVKVTGDHSVFKRGKDDKPIAVPVRELKKGDYVAIPSKLPVVVKDADSFNIVNYLLKNLGEEDLWNYSIRSEELRHVIAANRTKIYEVFKSNGKSKAMRQSREMFPIFKRYVEKAQVPLYVFKKLNLKAVAGATITVSRGYTHVPTQITVDEDLLWLLGFYLAEGTSHFQKNKSSFIAFSSDERYLNKAAQILKSKFGVHVIKRAAESNKSPSIFVHSKMLYMIFKDLFNVIREDKSKDIRIPSWIFQLPLSKVKYFLEGYKDGDGTHSGKKVGKELCFDTKFKNFATDLLMLLLRFNIVASFGEYTTKYKQKYGDKLFTFYRLTACELSDFNILNWDKGVQQTLMARKTGDLVWAWIRNIRKVEATRYVYDFSVPDAENFVAGNGVFCHNTYGPFMRKNDGRVVPAFISQALSGKSITVFGDGSQTRSFCYVTDLVEGIYRLMLSKANDPVNLGNPEEYTVLEFAKKILKLTGSSSKITFKPLPIDDPKTRCPDISRAKKFLNWQPKVSVDEGLKRTIEWFRKN